MNNTKSKKDFLTKDVMELLKNLRPDTEPAFGLMTAQHMVEHLSWSLKGCTKRAGEVENPPTKGQLGFQKFIENGAILQHRPSDKTKADLPELRYENLEAAIVQIGIAIERFYSHFEANPDFKSYSKFFGELNFEQLELFNHNHYRYHFWQFGLIEKYPENT
jgi:hypothetical protein